MQSLLESSNCEWRRGREHEIENHDIHLLHHDRAGEAAIKLKPEENKDKSLGIEEEKNYGKLF